MVYMLGLTEKSTQSGGPGCSEKTMDAMRVHSK